MMMNSAGGTHPDEGVGSRRGQGGQGELQVGTAHAGGHGGDRNTPEGAGGGPVAPVQIILFGGPGVPLAGHQSDTVGIAGQQDILPHARGEKALGDGSAGLGVAQALACGVHFLVHKTDLLSNVQTAYRNRAARLSV